MPSRKPDDLHELEGTSSRAEAEHLDTPSGSPRCPKDLDKQEKKVFRQTCRELEKRKHITSGDVEIIRILAIARMRSERAMVHVRLDSEVIMEERGDSHGKPHLKKVRNPWLDIAEDAEREIRACLDRLGLTPMNRPRVRPTKDDVVGGLIFK